MLFLQLRDGEYLTIGGDIVIQVFANSKVTVSVQAPKDLTVLRGEVLERNGEERPQCLLDQRPMQAKKAAPSRQSGEGVPNPFRFLPADELVEQ